MEAERQEGIMTILHTSVPHPIPFPDPHQDTFSKTVLGFWMYLDDRLHLIFGSLFATYAVLHNSTFGGPTSCESL